MTNRITMEIAGRTYAVERRAEAQGTHENAFWFSCKIRDNKWKVFHGSGPLTAGQRDALIASFVKQETLV